MQNVRENTATNRQPATRNETNGSRRNSGQHRSANHELANDSGSDLGDSYSDEDSRDSGAVLPVSSHPSGFVPYQDPSESHRSHKRHRDDDNAGEPQLRMSDADMKEMQQLLDSISTLLSQYPDCVPRSNIEQLESLRNLSLVELRNVLTNLLTDIRKIDGSPMGEFFTLSVGYTIDQLFLPGYYQACQQNAKLQRDIDNLVILYQGGFSPLKNILFRLVNIAVAVKLQMVPLAAQQV